MSNLLKYDVIYILDTNSTTEEVTAVATKIEQVVADTKGTVLKKDDWGKRRLAYLVQKRHDGHYFFYHLSLPPDAVAEITRNLPLLEKVLKFSVVKATIRHLKANVKKPRVKAPESSSQGHSSRPGQRPGFSPRPASSAPPTPPAPSVSPATPATQAAPAAVTPASPPA